MMRGLFAAGLICLIGGAVPAAAQAVSLLGTDATVQPSSSSPVRINQAFGSSGWSVGGSGNGPTTYTGNSLRIPGVSPARWFCYLTVAANRGWSMRTRTADFAAPNCPTNGLGSVSTTGLVAVVVEDGPPASVVAQFAMNSGFWTSTSGYARSSAQTALTTSEGTAIHARTADRVLVVHTGASGGTLCVTGTESGCSGALTWIPTAAAPTSVTAARATATGFTVRWSGGWTGSADATRYVFAQEVASGLTVDVSSGGMENGGPSSHAVAGRNASTRYVVTVCTQSGGMSCYDSSADPGIQGVAVTTLAAGLVPLVDVPASADGPVHFSRAGVTRQTGAQNNVTLLHFRSSTNPSAGDVLPVMGRGFGLVAVAVTIPNYPQPNTWFVRGAPSISPSNRDDLAVVIVGPAGTTPRVFRLRDTVQTSVTGAPPSVNYIGPVVSWAGQLHADLNTHPTPSDWTVLVVDHTNPDVDLNALTLYAPPPPPPPVVPAPDVSEPNQSPQVAEAPGAVELDPGGTAEVALSGTFQDPEGDPLEFSAASSRPAVATTGIGGHTLTVTAVAEGQARITVRAEDPFGATATVSFLVTVGNPVSIGGTGGDAGDAAGMAVAASAPEGGVAELAIAMAEPREEDVSFTYSFGPDSDPATADADAADHGGEGGTVTIPAGETEAAIRIPIADDDDIEPAREAFVVALQPMDGAGLANSSAVVHVEEGVCDRTWQVADALRGGRACAAVTPGELARRRFVRLPDAGLAELKPLDFLGLAGLRVLILDGNGLSALPEGLLAGSPALRVLRLRGNRFETLPALGSAPAMIELDLAGNLLTELPANPFENLPALGYLYLGGNGIEALPADLLAEAEGLRFLELQDNALEALPEGFFAGVPRLFSLQLQDNPGAPFSLPVELARVEAETDADADSDGEGDSSDSEGEDEEEPGRATIQLRVPHAAPFAVGAELSAPGATLSAQMATIAAGETLGEAVSVVRSVAGNEAEAAVTVQITSVPNLPATACGDEYDEYRCFRGFELTPGGLLTLFEPPAAADADVPTMR